ncbi:MAG TPA: hypothetical protein VNJ01_03405 [Bacteriovoracaceae bacterium]|nr:hypothetical protein [Bacteriovoracaceae bacterium]
MKSAILLTLAMSLFLTACGSGPTRNTGNNITAGAQEIETKRMEQSQVMKITNDWPLTSRQNLDKMVQKYGQPTEATNSMVIWQNNGPWKKSVLYKNQGKDSLEQTAGMMVPPEKLGELAMFNKALTVNQGNNEVSSRSNKEETNFLTLNLAKDIVDGKMSAMEARKQYSSVTDVMGRSEYMDNLNFGPARGSNPQSNDSL